MRDRVVTVHASMREVTAIGPHVPNLGAVVTLFGVYGVLLFL